jgi:hypothetical protein
LSWHHPHRTSRPMRRLAPGSRSRGEASGPHRSRSARPRRSRSDGD